MLFTYSDMIGECGSAYRIGKAVDSGEVFEVVRVGCWRLLRLRGDGWLYG